MATPKKLNQDELEAAHEKLVEQFDALKATNEKLVKENATLAETLALFGKKALPDDLMADVRKRMAAGLDSNDALTAAMRQRAHDGETKTAKA